MAFGVVACSRGFRWIVLGFQKERTKVEGDANAVTTHGCWDKGKQRGGDKRRTKIEE